MNKAVFNINFTFTCFPVLFCFVYKPSGFTPLWHIYACASCAVTASFQSSGRSVCFGLPGAASSFLS